MTLKDFPSQLTPSRPVEGSGKPDGVPPEFEFPSETDGRLALAWAFAGWGVALYLLTGFSYFLGARRIIQDSKSQNAQ